MTCPNQVRLSNLVGAAAAAGVMVTVGKTQGRVVRHIEDGFAIEFMRLQHPISSVDNVTGE